MTDMGHLMNTEIRKEQGLKPADRIRKVFGPP
jgi:hypothetical protein